MSKKTKVLVTSIPMANVSRHLKVPDNIELIYGVPHSSQAWPASHLYHMVQGMDGLIAGDDEVTADVVKDLQFVIKWGAGTDNVDIPACRWFANTPGTLGDEVADYALYMITGLMREAVIVHTKIVQRIWYKPIGVSLKNKVVAVLGNGAVGQAIIKRLMVAGAHIRVFDPMWEQLDHYRIRHIHTKAIISTESLANATNSPPPLYIQTNVTIALNTADVVVVACALNSDTYHLMSKSTLDALSPNAYLVNVARGPIVNTKDVVACLESGHLAGYATDVYEHEPPFQDEVSKSLLEAVSSHNVILGSHNAGHTIEAAVRTSELALTLCAQQARSGTVDNDVAPGQA